VVLVAIASLLTMAQLLLEIKVAYNTVANINTINIAYIEKLVKSFVEGSIHTELAISYSVTLLILVRVAEEMSKT
jgi:hypothetical protein